LLGEAQAADVDAISTQEVKHAKIRVLSG
jgi:hypothetical protein